MKRLVIFLIIIACPCFLYSDNYLINGGQQSLINYRMVQKIEPAKGTENLYLCYVVPVSFSSPTYNQTIEAFDVKFSVKPDMQKEFTDLRGNRVVRLVWQSPGKAIQAIIAITAKNHTMLLPIQTDAPYPLESLSKDLLQFLAPTKKAQADHPLIKKLAQTLAGNENTEFAVVQNILSWMVDHMHYVLMPRSYDALYSIKTGAGNCQNYSHVSTALLRAAGIPARVVNGVTLKQPYDIQTGQGIITVNMAQGRHSWIEVYFPDLGWIPFDPQQTALYVSNRFIRIESGLDNDETCNDGLISWKQNHNYHDKPGFEEVINAEFPRDQVTLTADRQAGGPHKLMFYPQVEADFKSFAPPAFASTLVEEAVNVLEQEPESPGELKFGNLDFPQNISFLTARDSAQLNDEGEMEMRKNFLVETTEYVTTSGNQYAQAFILDQAVNVEFISLALHNFGGDGQVWVELFKDNSEGKPGEYLATSEYLNIVNIPFSLGYNWVDFKFNKTAVTLSPGRYWLALGFTGSPIINWFYTYSKTVGPNDGTRYKTLFDDTWSRCLTWEFNYRVCGKIIAPGSYIPE